MDVARGNMRLRAAIKIMRVVEEPWKVKGRRLPRHSRRTIQKAWKICERKFHDRRVPCVPTDEEMEMRGCILTQLLLGGPIFGEGILEGLVPDEQLEQARKECGLTDKG